MFSPLSIFKEKVNAFLRLFRYSINRLEPRVVDVRNKSNDPRQFIYHLQSLLINAPASMGRIRFFPLSETVNPFVLAVTSAMEKDDTYETIKAVLNKYYSTVQPRNIYEWYNINVEDASGLSDTPVWAVPEPWKPVSLSKKMVDMKNIIKLENRDHGKSFSISEGDKGCGPVTEEKLCLETERLDRVMNSIRKKGYKRHNGHDGDIQAIVFIREDGEWCWQVSKGLHRTAVLAALKWQHIPVRVTSIVYRNDSEIWPNVLSGLYTKKGALKVFDKIFKGATAQKFKNNPPTQEASPEKEDLK